MNIKKLLYSLLGFIPFFIGWFLGIWLLPEHPWGMGLFFELAAGAISAFVITFMQMIGKFPSRKVIVGEPIEKRFKNPKKVRFIFILVPFIAFYIFFQFWMNQNADILIKTTLSFSMAILFGNSSYNAFILKLGFLENFFKNFKFLLLVIVLIIVMGFVENVIIHPENL